MPRSGRGERQLEFFGAGPARSPDAPTVGTPRAPAAEPVALASHPRAAPPPAAPLARVSRTKLLEETVRRRLGPTTRVLIVDTRSVLLSQSLRGGVRTVRVHQLFLDAPDAVREAVADFLVSGDRRAGAVVDAFVEAQDHLLAHHAAPLDANAHRGRVYELGPIFEALNERYFGGAIEADIAWGQRGAFQGRSRRSITLGSYDYRARRITIHPALDQPEVPLLCVARVVHHEMCHARHPAERSPSGRRVVHGPAFRREEARFAEAAEADAWLESNIEPLLRYRLKATGRRPKSRVEP